SMTTRCATGSHIGAGWSNSGCRHKWGGGKRGQQSFIQHCGEAAPMDMRPRPALPSNRDHRIPEAATAVICVADSHDIPGSERPIDVLHGNSRLLSHVLEGIRPLDGLLNVFNALLAERGKHDEFGHRNLFCPQLIASLYSVFARPISMNPLADAPRLSGYQAFHAGQGLTLAKGMTHMRSRPRARAATHQSLTGI